MHTVDLDNGHRLAYRDQGQGPAMVLVHGWGVSGELFREQLRELSARFRVVVPDLPGHGASDAIPQQGGFTGMADAIAQLIRKLQLEPVCLVGWSLGALVAWDLLHRHTDLPVSSLVTVDMVPRLLNDAGWKYGLREGTDYHAFDRDLSLMQSDWPAFVEIFTARLSSTQQSSKQLAGAQSAADWAALLPAVQAVAMGNRPARMACVWQLMVEQDLRQVLPSLHLPALVIAGGQSALYGTAAGEWVAAQMPNARLEIMDESGHAPHLDQPRLFNRLLAEFAASHFKHPADQRLNQQT